MKTKTAGALLAISLFAVGCDTTGDLVSIGDGRILGYAPQTAAGRAITGYTASLSDSQKSLLESMVYRARDIACAAVPGAVCKAADIAAVVRSQIAGSELPPVSESEAMALAEAVAE